MSKGSQMSMARGRFGNETTCKRHDGQQERSYERQFTSTPWPWKSVETTLSSKEISTGSLKFKMPSILLNGWQAAFYFDKNVTRKAHQVTNRFAWVDDYARTSLGTFVLCYEALASLLTNVPVSLAASLPLPTYHFPLSLSLYHTLFGWLCDPSAVSLSASRSPSSSRAS